jgi:hypothetical protein
VSLILFCVGFLEESGIEEIVFWFNITLSREIPIYLFPIAQAFFRNFPTIKREGERQREKSEANTFQTTRLPSTPTALL